MLTSNYLLLTTRNPCDGGGGSGVALGSVDSRVDY